MRPDGGHRRLEDATFWTNEGIDFKGVVRAAWNNFTGGPQQGASTITQQYARVAYDLQGSTYSRKLNEAVLAWRLDDELDKKKILQHYLNTVPFGRGTYGIEAAAQAYYGKTVDSSKPAKDQITVSEAMVLVAMVKQPEPVEGAPGYDLTYATPEEVKNKITETEARKNAIDRWNSCASRWST
jgi:membrane peptidoglycan carboxypeptidase